MWSMSGVCIRNAVRVACAQSVMPGGVAFRPTVGQHFVLVNPYILPALFHHLSSYGRETTAHVLRHFPYCTTHSFKVPETEI
jgi:hypothetical protein